MRQRTAHPVSATFELIKQFGDIGVVYRPADRIFEQVLLANIGDIGAIITFGEKVIKRLVAMRAYMFRDGFIPFFRIGKHGIDIENHPAKIKHAMLYKVANAKSRAGVARNLNCAACLS